MPAAACGFARSATGGAVHSRVARLAAGLRQLRVPE
jgi:hypothetical protein